MNKIRKIFIIISIIICIFTTAFIVSIKKIKTNIYVDLGNPYAVCYFDHSTNGEEINNEDLNEFLEEFHKLTVVSVYDRLINETPLENRIYQDDNNNIVKWSTNLKNNNTVIEFTYDSMQDLVVYQGNNSRVISYYCLAFVIPDSKEFTNITVYYSFTNNTDGSEKDESYASCSPLMLYGNSKQFINYLEKIKETQN